jgi:hypothetical protein
MMRGRRPVREGETLAMNSDWAVVKAGPGLVELRNLQTNDRIRIPVRHLFSLMAIAEEVRRTHGESM